MDSPREREDLLREITEICGAAGILGDGDAEADALGEGDGDAEADALGEGEGEGDAEADALGEGDGDATTTEAVPSNTS